MRILWVTNSPIGPAADILERSYNGSSGGWIRTEYERLDKENMEFAFLCTLPAVKKGMISKKSSHLGTVYCLHAPRISSGIRPGEKEQRIVQKVIDEVKPDVIHVWGTETWISNAVAKAETNAPKVIFIQGLMGVHQRYLGGYYKNNQVNKEFRATSGLTAMARANVRRISFLRQAEIEKETIRLCGNVIIDSQFAQAYCESVSGDIRCHRHVLRPGAAFYQADWNYEECEKNSVFTIFGSNPEKGTQNLLRALHLLKKQNLEVKAYIPGDYQLDANGRLIKTRKDGFQSLLFDMIQAFGLESNVIFTGRLTAPQMAETMKKCNVFVNTSCMEVHALSLREAMVVGMPCISSLCGSVSEYLRHGENGMLYRFEEYESLALELKTLLLYRDLAQSLSRGAKETFQGQKNKDLTLNEIYEGLQKQKCI